MQNCKNTKYSPETKKNSGQGGLHSFSRSIFYKGLEVEPYCIKINFVIIKPSPTMTFQLFHSLVAVNSQVSKLFFYAQKLIVLCHAV